MFAWLKKLFGGKGEPTPTPPRPQPAPVPEVELASAFAIRSGEVPIEMFPIAQGIEEWHRRRKNFAQTGKWPLMVTAGALDHGSRGEPEESAADVLEQASQVDAEGFLQEKFDNWMEEMAEHMTEGEYDDPDLTAFNPVGNSNFEAFSLDRSTHLGLIEIPCQNPAEVFAEVAFGGWNEVPFDPEILAVFRYWNEKHGAVPATLSTDIVECWLDHPVNSPELASDLAKEQFAFCPDIVDQGTGTIHSLAESLCGAKVWYFWWD